MKEDTRTTGKNKGRVQSNAARTDKGTDAGMRNTNLHRLKDLDDYKVASDDPDVRGWTLISGDNQKIGKVDELIVDTKRMKVRYLVVDAKKDFIADKNEHHFLVPIGAARLHEKDNDVIVSNLNTQNLKSYPVYRGDEISRDYENSIRRFYEAGGTVTTGSSARTTQHETIRDAHTGKTYERQDRPGISGADSDSRSRVDSNSRNRVDVVTGTSGDEKAHGTGQMSSTPQENRMGDRSLEDSNTINSGHSSLDRRPDSNTPLGEFNTTNAGDVRERIQTRGISSNRTSNLPNKELREGPASEAGSGSDKVNPKGMSEAERVRIHDTDPKVDAPKGSDESGFQETNNLNRSTSMGNDYQRGSNMGNLENNKSQNPGINDRSRMSSPEFTDRTTTPGASRHPDKFPEGATKPVRESDLEHHSDELPDDRYDPDTDEFYTHEHFDEEKFYGNRRKRNEE